MIQNLMNFLELTKRRRSIRRFVSKEIEKEKIEYIMECVRRAPSAVNNQPWLFYFIKNEKIRKDLQKSYPREWFEKAPLYIVACADNNKSWKRSYDSKDFADIDLAIAIEHLCLAAAEQNLGTCWVCNFDPELCSKTLNLPEHIYPVAIIPIGYSDESKSDERERKALEEIIRTL